MDEVKCENCGWAGDVRELHFYEDILACPVCNSEDIVDCED